MPKKYLSKEDKGAVLTDDELSYIKSRGTYKGIFYHIRPDGFITVRYPVNHHNRYIRCYQKIFAFDAKNMGSYIEYTHQAPNTAKQRRKFDEWPTIAFNFIDKMWAHHPNLMNREKVRG